MNLEELKNPAPNLGFEKSRNPAVKYLAIITIPHASHPALGENVSDEIDFALSKIARKQ